MSTPETHTSSVDLEAISQKHWCEVDSTRAHARCHWDDAEWPCHTVVALAEVERLKGKLAAQTAVVEQLRVQLQCPDCDWAACPKHYAKNCREALRDAVVVEQEAEIQRLRGRISQAFDAMSRPHPPGKFFTKYPCTVCGAQVSNAGYAYRSHERGKVHQAALKARLDAADVPHA